MDISETLNWADYLILGSTLFVESIIDLALTHAVWNYAQVDHTESLSL